MESPIATPIELEPATLAARAAAAASEVMVAVSDAATVTPPVASEWVPAPSMSAVTFTETSLNTPTPPPATPRPLSPPPEIAAATATVVASIVPVECASTSTRPVAEIDVPEI